jgi:hypothetical protein
MEVVMSEEGDSRYVIETVADALLYLDWAGRFMQPPNNLVFASLARVVRGLTYTIEAQVLANERREATEQTGTETQGGER